MRRKRLAMVKKINVLVLLTVFSVLLIGCKESEEEQAKSLLNQAERSYASGNLQEAQLLLDSLHESYPKLVSYRRSADTISWRIAVIESSRNCVYLDSMLVLKREELMPMLKGFGLEKEEQYQDVGNYVPAQLRTERNAERCYLKPYTTEHGDFYLMSYYVGKVLNFNRMKISVEDMYSETGEAELADIHSYDDMGVYHETVMFNPTVLGSVPQFIYDHCATRMKVTLIGKTTYIYYLNELERNLLSETYALSVVLKDIYTLEDQLKKNKAKYTLNEQRLSGIK